MPKRQGRPANPIDDLGRLDWEGPEAEWKGVYLDALDATGQIEQAQRLRWAAFEQRLFVDRLRAYLKALPDFEDALAEGRAMAHALGFRNCSAALHFLHAWPAPRKAVRLVLTRHAETGGNLYWLLDPAARWLEGADPLAATLLHRAMTEDTLSLAPLIGDYGQFETHAAFLPASSQAWSQDRLLDPGDRAGRGQALTSSPGRQSLPGLVRRMRAGGSRP